MTRRPPTITLVPFCLLLLVQPAAAQDRPSAPIGGESPTAGVRLPVPSLIGSGDASALETNPGALGLLSSWSLYYHHAGMREAGRIGGTGDAFFLASPLPLLGSLVVGGGLQWLRPPAAIGYANSVKLDFGLSWHPTSKLSLGFAYHGFISDGDEALDGLETLDLGLVIRPTQWLAAAAAVRDLTTPVYDGLPAQRVYDLELAFRPALSRRLELGLGVRVGERRGDFDPRVRLSVEPLAGLQLLGDVEILRRDFYRTGDNATDVRATIALGLNLERIGMIFSTTLGRRMREQGPLVDEVARGVFQGVGVTLTLSGERREPLIRTQRRLIVLKLKGKIDQHKMVQLVSILSRIERRDDVTGVLLQIESPSVGWAQAQELRLLVKRLRRAGKQTYAYLMSTGARGYYIAAAAEQLMIDPEGGVRLTGLGVQALYLRGTLDKIGVEPQFIKIAEYKSAPETFTHKKPSKAAVRVREALLDDIFGQLVRDIARDRGKKRDQVRKLIDRGLFTSPDARTAGLVDQLVTPGDLRRIVAQRSRAVPVQAESLARRPDRWPVGPSVAVIVIEGDIVRGKSRSVPLIGQQMVGDESVVEAIEWARRSGRVRGIVLRINSPGGSALASAHMWRAVRRARKVKPVVVSFGDVAASGGYYAGCGADRIFAMPATITGSIGIFSGKFNLAGLLAKLGVNVDSSARGKRALISAFDRGYTKDERKAILDRLRHHYKIFVKAVADGRKIKPAEVEAVARGRVWTGNQARSRKLVDASGGLLEAIREVKRRAGLPVDRPVPLFVVPRRRRNILQRVLKLAGAPAATTDRQLPAAARRLLRAVPASLLEMRAGEPMTRLPFRLQLPRP